MRRTPLVLLGLLAVACGGAKPACPPIEPLERGPAFLWKAAPKDGRAIVWLYGTIHNAGLDAVPPAALAAFDRSSRLVTEVGDGKPDPDDFRQRARIASGKGIDQQLPADDWWDLRDALRGKIKEDDLRRARPWYAMSLLTSYTSPTPGPSMDVLLAERANEREMPIEALETWHDALATLDAAVGIADLQEAIRARKAMRCDLGRLVAAYRAGDIVTMQALLVIPRTEQTLLAPRNLKWLPAIEQQFARGGAFVAVGLGHLLGDHSLVALLERNGYTVERIR
jgi:uncharacterized protein